MRILCIPDGLPIDYTIQLSNALVKKGESSIILLDTEEYKDNVEFIDENVEICTIEKFKGIKHFLNNIKKCYNNVCKIRSINPDIIHIQGGNLLSIIMLTFLKKNALITTFHDVKPHPGHNNILTRFVRFYFLKKSNNIFVHGRKLKNVMTDELNIPPNKVHAIPMGEMNVQPFKRYINKSIDEDGSVLFFGWIGYRKGLIYLIQAEPFITEEFPNTKIVIAGQLGSNSMNTKYFEICKQRIVNIKNFDIYPHHISWEKGAELFQKCSMVVLPYVETSQSGVIPTAYGFKKPVVVTDVGSMPEIVDEGITGFIVPPKDPKALAEAIKKILKDEKLREKMGKNSYKKLKEDLSWDIISDKTIKIYKKSLKN